MTAIVCCLVDCSPSSRTGCSSQSYRAASASHVMCQFLTTVVCACCYDMLASIRFGLLHLDLGTFRFSFCRKSGETTRTSSRRKSVALLGSRKRIFKEDAWQHLVAPGVSVPAGIHTLYPYCFIARKIQIACQVGHAATRCSWLMRLVESRYCLAVLVG